MAYFDEQTKEKYTRRADQLDAFTKPLRNLVWVGAIAMAAWVQFLGPGLTSVLRETSGSNALYEKMVEGFNDTGERLDFIEENIQPPAVANFNFNRVLGRCTATSCRGIPAAKAVIRSGRTGEVFELPFVEGATASDAGREGSNFIIPFVIPDTVGVGDHQYQFISLYPTCPWAREPIPRQSPWFDLTVYAQ